MNEREVPTDKKTYEYLWRNLVEAEMRFRGYSDDEIKQASESPPHTDQCEFDHNSYHWYCTDENGEPFHPIADEYGELADLVDRTLDRIPECNR